MDEDIVEVKRFRLPDLWIGIEDTPDILFESYTDPERFELGSVWQFENIWRKVKLGESGC